MIRISCQGFHCLQIKALDIDDAPKQPGLKHIDQIAGNAAKDKTAHYPGLLHHAPHIDRRRQAGAAGACLEGEPVPNQPRCFDDLSRLGSNLQLHRILGDFRCA